MTRTVTVVGAGPAGLAAARILGREGVDFTLIDSKSFPRYKGCGGGLTPRSIRVLGEIFPEIEPGGFETREISFRNVDEGVARDLVTYISKRPLFFTVDRKELDHSLLKSVIDRGGDFVISKVREIEKTDGGLRNPRDRKLVRYRCRRCVRSKAGKSGTSSIRVSLSRLQFAYRKCLHNFYAGWLPLEVSRRILRLYRWRCISRCTECTGLRRDGDAYKKNLRRRRRAYRHPYTAFQDGEGSRAEQSFRGTLLCR